MRRAASVVAALSALAAFGLGCDAATRSTSISVSEEPAAPTRAPIIAPITAAVPTIPSPIITPVPTDSPVATHPPTPAPPAAAPPANARSKVSAPSGAAALSWPCRIDEAVPAQRDLRYAAFAGNLAKSGLPRASVQGIANQLPLIDANLWAYCGAERATGVPALVIAALHDREANNDPTRSIMSGEPLGTTNPDTHIVEPASLGDNAIRAAGHLRDMARSVYGITVRSNMSPAELAYAALAYNRGSMYCRGENNGVGQLHPMTSPYVSSGLFEEWVGMAWPDLGGSSVGSPEAWGEPASVRGRPDLRPGVYVVLRGLGSEIGIQPFAWNTDEVQIPCR